MKHKKYFYERSNLLESYINIKFEDLLFMDNSDTNKWIDGMRNFILSFLHFNLYFSIILL